VIIDVIKHANKLKATDIHITEGKKIAFRIDGEIVVMNEYIETPRDVIVQFLDIAVPESLGNFVQPITEHSVNSIDFSFTEEKENIRVRCQAFKDISGMSLAVRLLYGRIPSIRELNLPQSIERFTKMHDGLVIFTGATGSGKSTTLASILDEINNERAVNILTIEDPIEYVHKDKRARIFQREVGKHVGSFATATVEALRQDPDIIQVGEMRDLVTIENALIMAETGHLVFGTMHALSVVDTIDRIVNVFPDNAQNQIRFSLSNVLRGVVSQKLVKSNKGGRVPICEIMMVDDVIANLIRKQHDKNSFRDTFRSNKALGSVHLVDNVIWHIQQGNLTLDYVKQYLSDNDYELLVNNLGARQIR